MNTIDKSVLAIAFYDQNLCARTGTCVGICPENAISLDENYYPVLDETLCTTCGKCGEVCPGGQVNFEKLSHQSHGVSDDGSFDGHFRQILVGHATNHLVREKGTGGGIITALAIMLLESGEVNGCVVTRMRADKPWLGEPFIATTRDEIMESTGSRYTVIPLNETLRTIRQNEGEYAIIGLPCHNHGLRHSMAQDEILASRIKVILGTFCGGTLEPIVVPELLKTKNIPLDSITDFEFRGGEWPGQMRAVFADKPPQAVHFSNYKDGAYNYLIGIYMPRRCQVCYDGSNLFADLAVGDAWTRDENGRYKHNSQSRVLVRNALGQTVVQQAIEQGVVTLNDVSQDPCYKTHRMSTQRKGLNAPLRYARWQKKNIPVPQYDRSIPQASSKEKRGELLISMFLWTGRIDWLRYGITKILTSKAMIPLIKLRLWRKKRKYQKRASCRS
jgi:coenzyme F420 hydrogenase subunit beta